MPMMADERDELNPHYGVLSGKGTCQANSMSNVDVAEEDESRIVHQSVPNESLRP